MTVVPLNAARSKRALRAKRSARQQTPIAVGASNGSGASSGVSGFVTVTSTSAAAVAQPQPRLTETGVERLLRREQNPCGPEVLKSRVLAVAAAQRQDEAKLLVGALEDLAACAVAYASHLRRVENIPRKDYGPKTTKVPGPRSS